MDSRISLTSSCNTTLNTKTQEAQCNVQMFPPTIKQETLQYCDEKESNCDNHMSEYNSLKSPNCVNYYDGQFCTSVEVKEEFPEDEYPQSSTATLCINKSPIDSNIVYENEELSKVLETREIKQEVSEEAFSFIKTEEIHDKKDKFIATSEMSEEYRILGNAGDTSVPYKGQTTHHEIQLTMCGGILKNRIKSLTHNNEHIKNESPTLVGNEGNELHKCPCCDEYFNHYNILEHVDNVHSHKNHKSELCDDNINEIHAGRNVDEINYKCDSCKRIYKSKSALILHFKKIHYGNGRLFECWCGKKFPTKRHLYQHKFKQHAGNVTSRNNAVLRIEFQCEICKKMFKYKSNLRRHITSIHYDYGKTFECWCGKQFSTTKQLYKHKRIQHDADAKSTNNAVLKTEYQCDICKKMFKSKGNLRRHTTSIHYDYGKKFECMCGKQFRTPAYLYQHKKNLHKINGKSTNTAALQNQFQCEICKKIFIKKCNLIRHITSIHYDYGKIFICWCGKQFRTPIHLSRHKYRRHGGKVENTNNAILKTQFQCDICKKYFKSKDNLIIHIRSVHYDYGKTFECSCGKQFPTPRHLYRHENRQNGASGKCTNNAALKNQFQCDVCKKIFKDKDILKRHIASVHYLYVKTFVCWCGKRFPTPIHLSGHKCWQHGPKVENNTISKNQIQCDICKKYFKSKDNLKIHLVNIHYDYGKTFKCSCGKQFRTPLYLKLHQKDQRRCISKNGNKNRHKREHCKLLF